MPTKTHQSIREYVEAIRPIVDRGDAFGSYIMRMMHRESRVSADGLFQCVREIREAVIALNGTSAEAREWTLQSFLWWSTGKAVEQKFAKYELDPRAAHAMDQLIKRLQTMPEELIKVTPPALPSPFRQNANPFGSPPNPFANKPTPPPTSPFGSKPAAAAPPPARPPFGQAQKPSSPFGQPAPTPPKPSAFGSRPNAPTQQPALPYHLAICFDALDIVPATAQNHSPFPFGRPVEKVEEPLPTDLRGLLDRWIAVASEANEATPILHKIGELDDLHTLDIIHNLTGDGSTEINLIDTYKHIGSNVGVAGLLSLLPLTDETRINWLDAMWDVTQRAMRSTKPLSEATLDTVWKIAVAESAQTVTFCPASLYLLAATQRSESLHILWTHARSEEEARRRVALYAIVQLDPGDTLGELLIAINDLPPLMPAAQRTPFQNATPIEMEITYVGIPFERLESMVRHSKLKQALVALRFLSYHNDERGSPHSHRASAA